MLHEDEEALETLLAAVRRRHPPRRPVGRVALALLGVLLGSCIESAPTVSDTAQSCQLPTAFLADGGPGVDGIPALTDPEFVAADDPRAAYVRDNDRVIGFRLGGEYRAVPLNIGWWHEVVNLQAAGVQIAVTHCPLTGSSLVFDRSAADGATFGVSGVLFMNNLMLFDRREPASLWPQMARGARCGPRTGTALQMLESIEMTWRGWRTLHPDTRVVSVATGHDRDYRAYPYGNYDVETNALLLGPNPALDTRRPPKERVLGIVRGGSAAVALPFGTLRARGAQAVVMLRVGDADVVVFWDGEREAAAAFLPRLGDTPLTFRVDGGRIVDDQTGSTWSVDGLAVQGARSGARLAWAADSFVAYWFAWASFHPESVLWNDQ